MKCSVKVKALISAAAVVGLIFAIGGCKGLAKPKEIDLTQYVRTSFFGYDTVGKLEYSFDYDELMDDMEDMKIKFDDDDVEGTVKLTPDKVDGLSNGDKVKFEMDVKGRLEKRIDAVFIYDDFDVKVSGLKERTLFDPFEYVDVLFLGTSPQGYVMFEPKGSSPVPNINYMADDGDSYRTYKNGDVVTITAYCQDYKDLGDACSELGYELVSNTKECTFMSREEYVASLDQIDPILINELTEHGIDIFYSKTNWLDDEVIDAIDYCGVYFLCLNDGLDAYYGRNSNYLYIVYMITVTNPNETLHYFYYVRYMDILTRPNGSCDVYNINDVDYPYGSTYSGDTVWSEGKRSFYYVGYPDVNTLYNKVIVPQSEDYTIETNVFE
ncbi:MAG: hypothetical protein IKE94_16335 [Aeriscardovia sp.]|nr:hypothetical protein [Aeriscardovia sp.]